jgi:hypothetical protein
MEVDWEYTALAAFDHFEKREREAITRAVDRLAINWDQLRATHLIRLQGPAIDPQEVIYSLRAGKDLRVLLTFKEDHLVILDIVRHSQMQRLGAGLGRRGTQQP